jgi:hypothetical protein
MKPDKSFTLHDLQLTAAGNTPRQVTIGMIYARSHADRNKYVNMAIDWIAQEFAKNRQSRFDHGEDALTADVIIALRAMGFDATHDTQIGGHVDIVIEEADNFLWLGEAKIHKTYNWLLSGFLQLDTRYSTGLPGQDNGALLIYCQRGNMSTIMEKWTEHLVKKRPDVTVEVCATNPLVRRSCHLHGSTQLPFYVRHVPFNLHFKPQK